LYVTIHRPAGLADVSRALIRIYWPEVSEGEAEGEGEGDSSVAAAFFFGDADGEASALVAVFFFAVVDEVEVVVPPAFFVVLVDFFAVVDAEVWDVVVAVSFFCAQETMNAALATNAVKQRINFLIGLCDVKDGRDCAICWRTASNYCASTC